MLKPFTIERLLLPHVGIIPGARGHKKVEVAKGTHVYCITYGSRLYWSAYLSESQAIECLTELEEVVNGTGLRRGRRRKVRQIPLDTLVAWNFTWKFPVRICRP